MLARRADRGSQELRPLTTLARQFIRPIPRRCDMMRRKLMRRPSPELWRGTRRSLRTETWNQWPTSPEHAVDLDTLSLQYDATGSLQHRCYYAVSPRFIGCLFRAQSVLQYFKDAFKPAFLKALRGSTTDERSDE
jgi:hypothetical protein